MIGLAERDVQLVDLGPPLGVLRVPHPLLADDVDLQRIGRRLVHPVEHHGRPDEHHHLEEQRHADPEDFHDLAVLRRVGAVGPRPAAVPRRERHDEQEDQRREERGDRELVEGDGVDLPRGLGGLIGE